MNSESVNLKSLCTYQDEAIGAIAVPLTIRGQNLLIKKSSDYFAKSAIEIKLQTSGTGEILNVQLGSDICIDLKTMMAGLEVGPLGLFPVHVLQFDSQFDSKTGGTLRFGFLKKIMVKESLSFALTRLLSFFGGSKSGAAQDLSCACESYFGNQNWGTFDIVVKRQADGNWGVFTKEEKIFQKSIETLIAKFNVNKAGIVLGIEEMYCQ